MTGVENRLQEIIPNLRRVSGTRLFRSSRPDRLTNGSNIALLGKLGIKAIVDLRSSVEMPGETLLDSYYRRISITPGKDSQVNEQNEFIGKHYIIELMGKKYKDRILKRLSLTWRFVVVMLFLIDKLFGTMYAYKTMVTRVLNQEGCAQQYIDMISCSGEEIVKTVELLSDTNNIPALISCSWGKDRTGILSALVQELCGMDRQLILDDYAKSERVLEKKGLGLEMKVFLRKFGLHPRYAESKPEAMEAMYEYIVTEYGSVVEYLQLHGLSPEKITKIVANVKL